MFLLFLSAIEWGGWVVLDLGLPVYTSLAPATRALAGLFQSVSVRASGFAILNLAALAPALQ